MQENTKTDEMYILRFCSPDECPQIGSLAVASRPLQRRLQICINWSITAAIVSLLSDFLVF
jgi:hypothetical protein